MLNLTRKWRAQTFDTLVGQDLVVKILKNSLYIAHYFPVYLFSGQRGCGKTSTARIFAAALNCTQLATFQAKPKETIVPCGSCDSCLAMMQFRHPDFIEIDAASHTGVDNMRTIIDAAYYLPILGRKKIYLIDEAHMLSKAAFNALLKIFEEPPMHAHFILATTDPEKIIETVRSRCFSLFFGAIEHDALANHLKQVCQQEKIEYTDEALVYIARASEGSARDALNMLETIRFSNPIVTLEAVLRALGHVDDQKLTQLMVPVLSGDMSAFLATWSEDAVQRASPQHIWSSLVRMMRGIVWHRHGVVPTDVHTSLIQENFSTLVPQMSTQFLEMLYGIEPLFIRSGNQRALLEFALLQLCARFKKKSHNSPSGLPGVAAVASPLETELIEVTDEDEEDRDDGDSDDSDEEESDDTAAVQLLQAVTDAPVSSEVELLQLCVHSCAQLTDPLLASVLSQIISITKVAESNQLKVQLSTQHSFFAEMLNAAAPSWHPLVATVYNHTGSIVCVFDGVSAPRPAAEKKVSSMQPPYTAVKKAVTSQTAAHHSAPQKTAQPPRTEGFRASGYQRAAKPVVVVEKSIDVSDIQRWPLTNRVLSYFPGTVTVVDEARL